MTVLIVLYLSDRVSDLSGGRCGCGCGSRCADLTRAGQARRDRPDETANICLQTRLGCAQKAERAAQLRSSEALKLCKSLALNRVRLRGREGGEGDSSVCLGICCRVLCCAAPQTGCKATGCHVSGS